MTQKLYRSIIVSEETIIIDQNLIAWRVNGLEHMNISRMTAAMYRTGQSILVNRLQHLDLNGGQMDCLLVITLREGLSQMELAQLLFAGKSVTAKWVKVLIEKGYVRRQADDQDKRVCHLYLTEKGRAAAPAVQQIFREQVQLHLRNLTEAEALQLTQLMEKVLTGLLQEKERLESLTEKPISENGSVYENEKNNQS